MKKTIQIVLILFLIVSQSFGQDEDSLESGPVVWLDASAGIGGFTNFAFTATGEVRLQYDHHLLTLQTQYSKEIELIFSFLYPRVKERMYSLGLLYGRTYSFHLKRLLFPFFPLALIIKNETDFSFSASAGIGICAFTLRGSVHNQSGDGYYSTYDEDRTSVVNIPMQLELVQNFSPSFGYVHRFTSITIINARHGESFGDSNIISGSDFSTDYIFGGKQN